MTGCPVGWPAGRAPVVAGWPAAAPVGALIVPDGAGPCAAAGVERVIELVVAPAAAGGALPRRWLTPGAIVPGVNGPFTTGEPGALGLAVVTPGATVPGVKFPLENAERPGAGTPVAVATAGPPIGEGGEMTTAPVERPSPVAVCGDTMPAERPEKLPKPGTITPLRPPNALLPSGPNAPSELLKATDAGLAKAVPFAPKTVPSAR